jgi:Leu/Phe-tRNA-protein transferase
MYNEMSPRQPSSRAPAEQHHHHHQHDRGGDDYVDVEHHNIQEAVVLLTPSSPSPQMPHRTRESIQPNVESQKVHVEIRHEQRTTLTTATVSNSTTSATQASFERSHRLTTSVSSVVATAVQEPQQPLKAVCSNGRANNGNNIAAKTKTKKTIKDYIPHYLKRYIQPAMSTGSSQMNDDGDDNEDDDVDDTDFCMSTYVTSTKLIAYCMMEGFLPMAYNNYILLPKLHTMRSIIPLRKKNTLIPIPVIPRPNSNSSNNNTTNGLPLPYDLHISKNTRKRSKHYYMTINAAFETVIRHCQQQHGGESPPPPPQHQSSCWLYPTLLNLFRTIHMATIQQRDGYVAKCSKQNQPLQISIRLYSIEVWNAETNEFAAGEIGYTVGDTIYTSLTGCCVEDSAGSVQMAALGALLIYLQSFHIWDLGMDMPYKQTLGAQLIPRQEFITLVHALRVIPERNTATTSATTNTTASGTKIATSSPMSSLLSSLQWPIQQMNEPVKCRDIIDAISVQTDNVRNATSATTADTPALPLNKKQRKEMKKKSRADNC